ncbi:TVP38/TMEM64 family protein [Pseudotabrizicola alkalilacus]|uniref:TVP38/TMEM64 family membrane protein n=1 Tax=Pseudotabrizicola alkalilacus TaxID=2305252 RepID=A0A411Z722_9RHOB|nr:VTT domain-containing protein [Pseudotabrizicola alkalilacus]RGP38825.1 TVP38/TMEM64 family protein [Pseudotabrizicola alkalilacus]
MPTTENPWLKRLPILVIAAVAVLGAFLLRDQFSFDSLARHRESLLAFRDGNFAFASLVFVATYMVIVAFSLPGATIATLTGGFLFGLFPGVFYNVGAATLGAVAIFLAARAGFGADVAARIAEKGGAAARLQQGLRDNEWSALLIMRLVPVVPFFIANLLPAFVGASLMRFAVTTFFGIIPGGLVFTSVGAGLGEVFARGETPDLSIIFAPHIIGPILGLAALSALPVLLKRFKREA